MFLLIKEYFDATPLVTVYTRLNQAEAAYDRFLLQNYRGKRVSLQEVQMTSMGWDQATDIKSERFDEANLLAS